MHSFTPEDLVQYLYNETSTEKTAAIKAALDTDFSLREKFDVIAAAQKRLETLQLFAPRKKAVDNILNYASKSEKAVTTEV